MKRVSPALILICTIVAVAALTWWFSRPQQEARPASATPSAVMPTQPVLASDPAPTMTSYDPEGEGWDGSTPEPSVSIQPNVPSVTGEQDQMDDEDGVAELTLDLAQQFVDGWGDATANREVTLKDVTHPALYTSLTSIPLNRRIEATAAGAPTIQELSSSRVVVEQSLVDRSPIWLLLTDDPNAPHGWFVVSVEPRPET